LKRRRPRRQHVNLRPRHRQELTKRLRSLGIFAAALGVVVVLGRAVFRESAWAPGFIRRHTPQIEFQAPATLADLPLIHTTYPGRFGLWLPGADASLRKKWMREFPAVRSISFEKRFGENRIIARVEPRIPLVRLDDRGLDRQGVVFKLASQNWTGLPKANIPPQSAWASIGRWLAELTRVPDFWNRVTVVTQGPRGEMWIETNTGTKLAWGSPDSDHAFEKARGLSTVLKDASERLSGAAMADARFFEEGRVVIRPKTVSFRNDGGQKG
jgi:hypothetical protein